MHSIAFLLALASLSTLQDRGLLSGLPEGAFALAYCPDPSVFRERARANDWVRMLASDEGKPLYVDLEEQLQPATGSSLRSPLDVGLELSGESIFFVAPHVSGLLTVRPQNPERLIAAMQTWLAERAAARPEVEGAEALQAELRTVSAFGGRIEFAIAPSADWPVRTAAFFDHPRVLGLLTAVTDQALLLALRDSLTALEKGEERALAQGFRAARAAHGPLALECYVDFSPFIAPAEAALAEAGKAMEIDPTGLLGLENGTTLYLTADMQAGDRVELRGGLAIPPETLAASLADTFVALPSGLAAMLPKSTWGTIGLGWNYMAMVDRAREAFDAAGQEGVGKSLDQGLAAAGAATGVDVEEQLLRQLTGTFLFFFGPPPEEGKDFPPVSVGAEVWIADAGEFVDAFEAVIGMTLGDDATGVVQIEGQDVYSFDEELHITILPDHALCCLGEPFFTQAMTALLCQVHSSAATGTRLEAAIAENQGASFFACFELTPLRDLYYRGLRDANPADAPADAASADRDAPNPFESQLVASARRTKLGFDLRLYTR